MATPQERRLMTRPVNVSASVRRSLQMLSILMLVGCGTTRDKLATEQLLLSDAVDRAVARIDFTPLSGETVYLDTTYLRQIKGPAFVNADYIISSLRQQMVLAGCLLQDNRDEADYVAEARVGVLGSDAHDVNYGVPGSNGLTAAASLVGGTTPLPSLPEISFARKTDETAATKVAVFAYHRETREPVWQSGLSVAQSRAQAKWFLGAGPFKSGAIYQGSDLAGKRIGATPLRPLKVDEVELQGTAYRAYRDAAVWDHRLQDKLRETNGSAHVAAQADVEDNPTDAAARPVEQVQFTEEVAEEASAEATNKGEE